MTFIRLIFSLLALMVTTHAAAQDSKLVEAAKKEGKLIVYGTMQSDIFELLQKSFQKKTGIIVDYWRTSATKVKYERDGQSRRIRQPQRRLSASADADKIKFVEMDDLGEKFYAEKRSEFQKLFR